MAQSKKSCMAEKITKKSRTIVKLSDNGTGLPSGTDTGRPISF